MSLTFREKTSKGERFVDREPEYPPEGKSSLKQTSGKANCHATCEDYGGNKNPHIILTQRKKNIHGISGIKTNKTAK